jgi:membrane protein DedA with SNARE-associated domain
MLEFLQQYAQDTVEFVRAHERWAAPIAFALAFAESLVFISLVLPTWAALIGIGALIGAGDLTLWPIWIGAALGASFGDWVSYWLGLKIGPAIADLWPHTRRALLTRAEAFIRRWGAAAVFIGRFFGPLRASVPLVAGIFEMPYWQFQVANFTSAFLWAGVLLTVGDVASMAVKWAFG